MLHIGRKEFDVQTFRSGGKGGQHQDKVDTGVRIVHKESGASGESREHRSQKQNKETAFRRLAESTTFQLWLNRRIFEITERQSIEEKVDRQMDERNLLVEVREEGRWTPESEEVS